MKKLNDVEFKFRINSEQLEAFKNFCELNGISQSSAARIAFKQFQEQRIITLIGE